MYIDTDKMKIETDNRLLDTLFPPIEEVVVPIPEVKGYKPNCIIHRNMLLYGAQGSGKSETIRRLVEEAILRYGEENVNAMTAEAGHLGLVYHYLDNKPIQIVFVDDMTLVKQKKEDLATFFRIRHEWSKRTGRKNGYVLTIMGIHRFFAIPVELRTNFEFFLARSCPDNVYDKHFMKQYFKEDLLKQLLWIDMNRPKNRSLFTYTLWRDKQERQGFISLPLSTRSYFNEIKPVPNLEKGALIRYKGNTLEERLLLPDLEDLKKENPEKYARVYQYIYKKEPPNWEQVREEALTIREEEQEDMLEHVYGMWDK